MKFTALAAAALAVLATPALSEGWTTADLGDIATEAQCVAKAEQTGLKAKERWGAHSVNAGDWTVALYDIGNDNDFDALFTCTGAPGTTQRGTVIVYSVGNASDTQREQYANELKAIWKSF